MLRRQNPYVSPNDPVELRRNSVGRLHETWCWNWVTGHVALFSPVTAYDVFAIAVALFFRITFQVENESAAAFPLICQCGASVAQRARKGVYQSWSKLLHSFCAGPTHTYIGNIFTTQARSHATEVGCPRGSLLPIFSPDHCNRHTLCTIWNRYCMTILLTITVWQPHIVHQIEKSVHYDNVHNSTYTPTCSLGKVRTVSKNE